MQAPRIASRRRARGRGWRRPPARRAACVRGRARRERAADQRGAVGREVVAVGALEHIRVW